MPIAADGDGDAAGQNGLFALPFMRRAAEQQRAAAAEDAASLLRSIEAEASTLNSFKRGLIQCLAHCRAE